MSKKIIICADGTGQDDLKHTNVSRLYSILNLSDAKSQIGCYHAGVGTIPHPEVSIARTDPGVVNLCVDSSPFGLRHVRRWADLAVGYGLFQNVKDLYNVLIDHYADGDQLFLFGFSRGAFTVRVLAGLLCRCGLLLPEHRECYSKAFWLYKPHFEALNPDELAKRQAAIDKFKSKYSRALEEISFLGIWDTVKSVGYIWPKSLPLTRHNPIIKRVRHALAIGESRSFFVPTTWGGLAGETKQPIEGQDVQEVWFAGNHSDVGGGYDEAENDLAKISLKWMINQASVCHWGLRVDKDKCGELFARERTRPFTPHNELDKLGWRLSERLPRWELRNDPPPPKRLFKLGPSGRRVMGRFARLDPKSGKRVILIDSHAENVYSTGAPPWFDIDKKEIDVRFVNTSSEASA
jgi:uncharacterized protein (DUF2235 family)